MYFVNCRITIVSERSGQFVFFSAAKIEINRSTRTLIDTCRITIPTSSVIHSKKTGSKYNKTNRALIQRGDIVEVDVFYNSTYTYIHEFEGVVDRVTMGTPLVLECEDKMWYMKFRPLTLNGTYKLWDLLKMMTVGTELHLAPERTIPDIDIIINTEEVVVTEILRQIKKGYGLVAFITPRQHLFCGLLYTYNDYLVKLYSNVNVVNTKSLSFRDRNLDPVLVTVKVVDSSDKIKEFKYGEQGGDSKTIFLYGDDITEAKAKQMAMNEVNRFKNQKLTGSFGLKGLPIVRHTDVVKYTDVDFPERNGYYYIDGYTLTYGDSGINRNITIGALVSVSKNDEK